MRVVAVPEALGADPGDHDEQRAHDLQRETETSSGEPMRQLSHHACTHIWSKGVAPTVQIGVVMAHAGWELSQALHISRACLCRTVHTMHILGDKHQLKAKTCVPVQACVARTITSPA